MEMLILWGVPILAALTGLNRRLFQSYLTFCNLLFAVYVGIWSEPLISGLYSLPAEAAAFKPAASMLVLFKVVEQLRPDTPREFNFPAPVDKLGGGVCGFLSGMVLINFLAFLLCTVPQKQAVAGIVALPELERASTASLVSISNAVDRASFQRDADRDRLAPLLELARKADPPPPEEEEAVPVPLNPKGETAGKAEAPTEETAAAPSAEPAEEPAEEPADEPTEKPAPQNRKPLTFQQSIVKKAIPNAEVREGQIVVETPLPEE